MAPGSIRLSELEVDFRERQAKGSVLLRSLGQIRDRYDFIVLDCPPHVGILLVNALVACDLLIIPIQTDFLALHGLKLLFDTLHTLNKALGRAIRYRAVPTMKGNSGIIGYAELNALTHEAETLLNNVRQGKITPTHELIDLLLLVVDVLEAQVQRINIEAGTATPFNIEPVVKQLQLAQTGGPISLPQELLDAQASQNGAAGGQHGCRCACAPTAASPPRTKSAKHWASPPITVYSVCWPLDIRTKSSDPASSTRQIGRAPTASIFRQFLGVGCTTNTRAEA